jgi:hypothetical protein
VFEHRKQPLLPRRAFLSRLMRHFGFTVLLIAGSLGIGVAGYRFIAGLSWVNSLLNASMILGGMGPVDVLHSIAGMVFLVGVGVLLAPIIHRFYHRFHLGAEDR